VGVLRSEPLPRGYRVDFHFRNDTPHGIYMEKLYITNPQAKADDMQTIFLPQFDLYSTGSFKDGKVDAWSGGPPPTIALPQLVAAGDSLSLTLVVYPDAKQWFDNGRLAMAMATVTSLGEQEKSQIAWPFPIRH
jgi:hypothetical protein